MRTAICDVCQRQTNALDLEKIQISIFREGWVCDTCRQEIREQTSVNEASEHTEADLMDFEGRN